MSHITYPVAHTSQGPAAHAVTHTHVTPARPRGGSHASLRYTPTPTPTSPALRSPGGASPRSWGPVPASTLIFRATSPWASGCPSLELGKEGGHLTPGRRDRS